MNAKREKEDYELNMRLMRHTESKKTREQQYTFGTIRALADAQNRPLIAQRIMGSVGRGALIGRGYSPRAYTGCTTKRWWYYIELVIRWEIGLRGEQWWRRGVPYVR